MMEGKTWQADIDLPDFPKNLAVMLNANADRFGNQPIYQEVTDGRYQPLSWRQFQHDVISIQNALVRNGLKRGDRLAVLSPNRKEMLELELAVMAMGAIIVPIFAGYPPLLANTLVEFCEPAMVAVADCKQFAKLKNFDKLKCLIYFDPVESLPDNALSFSELTLSSSDNYKIIGEDIETDTVSLMMYTSGTMGTPKCVMLTHGNILSQQAAMHLLWQINCHDRFLSFLPWHHSFGGIYEKYSAIYNGAVLSLEHGFGKDIDLLIENWKAVKPTVFFSVPRVYQQLATKMMQTPELEKIIFHEELRFVFTAAAPLPKNISDMFASRNIPVYEGWGLTETSPCCTVTDPGIERDVGVVGKPIPGVSICLSDENEILVNGPNVMKGYYKNPEETTKVLSNDGWFATGDVGEFVDTGLKLISRKDRIFKLSNAEKVVPTEIENLLVQDCSFLSHAYLTGSGRNHPVLLLFPNKGMLSGNPDKSRLKEGCDCPHQMKDFAQCLTECLTKLSNQINPKYARPQMAMLIDHELSIENEELTPSMKLAPNVVGRIFKANIEHLYGNGELNSEGVYVINLES